MLLMRGPAQRGSAGFEYHPDDGEKVGRAMSITSGTRGGRTNNRPYACFNSMAISRAHNRLFRGHGVFSFSGTRADYRMHNKLFRRSMGSSACRRRAAKSAINNFQVDPIAIRPTMTCSRLEAGRRGLGRGTFDSYWNRREDCRSGHRLWARRGAAAAGGADGSQVAEQRATWCTRKAGVGRDANFTDSLHAGEPLGRYHLRAAPRPLVWAHSEVGRATRPDKSAVRRKGARVG